MTIIAAIIWELLLVRIPESQPMLKASRRHVDLTIFLTLPLPVYEHRCMCVRVNAMACDYSRGS